MHLTKPDWRRISSVCLAHTHARAGDAAYISGYIGKGDAFCEAITNFAFAYAEQTESNFTTIKEAIKSGRIEAKKDYENQ